MKGIVLGMYINKEQMRSICDNTDDTEGFPFYNLWKVIPTWEIMGITEAAIQKCDIIYFVIDGLKPISKHKGYTNKELQFVLSEPEYIGKTQFILNGNNVDISKVMYLVE